MKILQTFESYATLHVNRFLSMIDKNKLFNRYYLEKMFFANYAFERYNAPKGYKVVSIKVLDDLRINNNIDLKETFEKYYSNKNKNNDNIASNVRNNPVLDELLKNFDMSYIIENINNLKIELAFNQLRLNGINHKIRSLFIRDMLFLLGKETQFLRQDNNSIKYIENNLFTFPVDIWVKETLKILIPSPNNYKSIKKGKFGSLSKEAFSLAATTIDKCYDLNLSPIRVNMGIWFFASNIVSDTQRLKILMNQGPNAMDEKLDKFKEIYIF